MAASGAVTLLRHVFGEQLEFRDGAAAQRCASQAGGVVNPHDTEAQWRTKKTLGKDGRQGYKAQVCTALWATARRLTASNNL